MPTQQASPRFQITPPFPFDPSLSVPPPPQPPTPSRARSAPAYPAQLSLTALPFAVNAVANVGFGLAADRAAADRARRCSLLGVRRAATLTGLLGPAACHLLFPLTASPGVAICIVTLSFFLGAATASGYMANHADLSRHYAGLTFAIANTVATVPGLVAPPFTAWLLDATGSWAAVFVLAALINVACAFAYLVLSDARTVL